MRIRYINRPAFHKNHYEVYLNNVRIGSVNNFIVEFEWFLDWEFLSYPDSDVTLRSKSFSSLKKKIRKYANMVGW